MSRHCLFPESMGQCTDAGCIRLANVREGFLRLLIGWSSQCRLLGGQRYWGGLFLVYFYPSAVCPWGNCVRVPWFSFAEKRFPGGSCGAALLLGSAAGTLLSWAGTQPLPDQGSTHGPLIIRESIPVTVDTVTSKSLACDEPQFIFLEDVRILSSRCFVEVAYFLL